jgi:hypothetical protein
MNADDRFVTRLCGVSLGGVFLMALVLSALAS